MISRWSNLVGLIRIHLSNAKSNFDCRRQKTNVGADRVVHQHLPCLIPARLPPPLEISVTHLPRRPWACLEKGEQNQSWTLTLGSPYSKLWAILILLLLANSPLLDCCLYFPSPPVIDTWYTRLYPFLCLTRVSLSCKQVCYWRPRGIILHCWNMLDTTWLMYNLKLATFNFNLLSSWLSSLFNHTLAKISVADISFNWTCTWNKNASKKKSMLPRLRGIEYQES